MQLKRSWAFLGAFAFHVSVSITSVLLGLCHAAAASVHIRLVTEELIHPISFPFHFPRLLPEALPHPHPSRDLNSELRSFPSFFSFSLFSMGHVPNTCTLCILKSWILTSYLVYNLPLCSFSPSFVKNLLRACFAGSFYYRLWDQNIHAN